MSHTRRVRAATAGVLATGALVLSQAVGATTVALAAHGGSGMIPAIGAHPPRLKAGQVDPAAKPDFPLIFGCQKASAPLVCYGPDQLRHAYGFDTLINAGYTGQGRTIVIVDAFSDPALRRDLQIFDQVFGLPDPQLQIIAPDGETPFDPNDDNQVGWSGEIALDVEYAHAMAPGAKIVLVEAKTNTDSDIARARCSTSRTTTSATCSRRASARPSPASASTRTAPTSRASRSARRTRSTSSSTHEGITSFASAGDDGSAQPTCDGSGEMLAASTPASDPDVTAVGGTQLFADPRSGRLRPRGRVERRTRQFGAAGGGGFSSHFRQPASSAVGETSRVAACRTSRTTARSTTACSWRGAFGSPVRVRSTSSVGRAPGSPQWAALAAITAQLNHGRLGNINPALYRLPASSFHDVTKGNNAFAGVPGYTASRGWDPATGLGTPRAAQSHSDSLRRSDAYLLDERRRSFGTGAVLAVPGC